MADAASILGIPKKDLARGHNMITLDQLSAKQLGYVLSGVTERLSSSDIFESGGELVPGLVQN